MINILDLQFLGASEAIAVFLIETDSGPILIETGPYSTFPALEAGLARHGYTPADIKHVFITHIHFDHAGAAWAFAQHGATIYLHPFGEKHMNNPEKLVNSARRIYLDQMDVMWGEMKPIPQAQLRVVAHGETIYLDGINLKAWHTPGHAVHHLVWQIGDKIFTGDVAGVKIGTGLVVPPCPPPDINVEDWLQSIRLLSSLKPAELYLTHFGLVKADIPNHLLDLERHLLDWANWIKPYYEDQTPAETIIPIFEHYVQQQLVDGGATPVDLEKYAAANPAHMSVAGLLRYWAKKTEQ